MAEKTNAGAVALARALEARSAKSNLAKRLGIGPDLVSRWIRGERTPDTKHRAAIEDGLGISWRLWDQELALEDVDAFKNQLALQEAEAPVAAPTFLDPSASTGTDGVG